jgi:hypothetical protein
MAARRRRTPSSTPVGPAELASDPAGDASGEAPVAPVSETPPTGKPERTVRPRATTKRAAKPAATPEPAAAAPVVEPLVATMSEPLVEPATGEPSVDAGKVAKPPKAPKSTAARSTAKPARAASSAHATAKQAPKPSATALRRGETKPEPTIQPELERQPGPAPTTSSATTPRKRRATAGSARARVVAEAPIEETPAVSTDAVGPAEPRPPLEAEPAPRVEPALPPATRPILRPAEPFHPPRDSMPPSLTVAMPVVAGGGSGVVAVPRALPRRDLDRRPPVLRPVRQEPPRLIRVLRRVRPIPLAAAVVAIAVVALTLPTLWHQEAPATPSFGADAGTLDFSFATNGVSATTRRTEQAKLWYNDGSWWGTLFRPTRDANTINRFDAATGTWIDTGVIVDDRNISRADMLWDGTHLYAVSGGDDPTSDKQAAIIARFSYDAGSRTYQPDRGFPIRITAAGSQAFTIDKDDDGTFWVTYTNNQTVYAMHSLDTDRDWTTPFEIPVPEAHDITTDDISAVVAYDGHVGIMWSDQTDGAMYFGSHRNGDPDAAWSVTGAIEGPALADNHMSLKRLHDDPAGLVLATVKTSRNDVLDATPQDALIVLVVLRRDGSWERHTIGTVKENQTRPLLAVDSDHRELYVYTSAPCCSGGTIYRTSSSLDAIDFQPGLGQVVIRRGRASELNNPTSTKQLVNGQTGLLVVSADDRSNYYLHEYLPLTGAVVPKPTQTTAGQVPGASGEPGAGTGGIGTVWLTDGFENGLQRPWKASAGAGGGLARVENGGARTDRGVLHIASTEVETSFGTADVTLPTPASAIGASFDVKVQGEGTKGANVPLLRLLDKSGKRLATIYRQNSARGRIWISSLSESTPTDGDLGLKTWAHLDIEVIPTAAGAQISVRIDGRLANAVTVPGVKGAVIGALQWGNSSKHQPFDVYVDNVVVRR